MNRVLLPLVVFAPVVAVGTSQVSQPDLRLQVVPATVYKVDDPGGARTSSFVFNIAVAYHNLRRILFTLNVVYLA
ncbi:hypothetical protein [Edaphobacter modestus]|uniref:Uncharacterized protein n=1 Tax=Edaphobacter modestus TaxID=388466 RepID=A0A4Q7Z153_9BACT|nr:hypothetical protein [Edaphobacter modestus]RZU43263.1 hypothetical protein BDD14_4915 [Edaphobacter modestus]